MLSLTSLTDNCWDLVINSEHFENVTNLSISQQISAFLSESQNISGNLSIFKYVSAFLNKTQHISVNLSISQQISACLSKYQQISANLSNSKTNINMRLFEQYSNTVRCKSINHKRIEMMHTLWNTLARKKSCNSKKTNLCYIKFTVDENSRVWKSQKKSHSTLRAKRAKFTFWVDKS